MLGKRPKIAMLFVATIALPFMLLPAGCEAQIQPPLLLVNEALYEYRITVPSYQNTGSVAFLSSAYIGTVESWVSQTEIPKENLQANHNIIGAEIRKTQYGLLIVVFNDTEHRIYVLRALSPDIEKEDGPGTRPPMVLVDNIFYTPDGYSSISLSLTGEFMDDSFVYIGEVQSLSEIANMSPTENFQANHEIVGAKLYRSGDGLIAVLNTEWGEFYSLYHAIE